MNESNNRHINKTIRNALSLPEDVTMELVAMLLLRYCHSQSADGEIIAEQETDIKVNSMTINLKFKIEGL